jgi:hypothetical protein
MVDEPGGHIPVAGLDYLRVDAKQFDPQYVAYCLAGQWNRRFMRGAAILRADIQELELPLISLPDQHAVLAALDHAHDLSQKARATAQYTAVAETNVSATADRLPDSLTTAP